MTGKAKVALERFMAEGGFFRMNFPKLLRVLFLLIFMLTALCCHADSNPPKTKDGDASKMETPTIYQQKKFWLPKPISSIFSVPMKGTVGTNDLVNAISLISLEGEKADISNILEDFVENVGGGKLSFLSPISETTIAYAQSRRFILIDLKEKSFRQFLVCKRLEESVNRVAVVDAGKLTFLFEILAFSDDPTDTSDPERILRMVDLSAGSDTVVAERKLSANAGWSTHQGTTFLFDENGVLALDKGLNPTHHPFASLYAEAVADFSEPLRVTELLIHPQLPFAVVLGTGSKDPGERYVVWLAAWKDGEKPVIVPMIAQNRSWRYKDFEFSPDGTFLLMKVKERQQTEFIVSPVDPASPLFLGKPVSLGSMETYFAVAWIEAPLSLAVLEHQAIRVWDLTAPFSQ